MAKKKKESGPKSTLKVRRKILTGQAKAWPFVAELIIKHYTTQCVGSGRKHVQFEIPAIPTSLNHQYNRARNGGSYLKEVVTEFRDLCAVSMGPHKYNWQGTGLLACVILFESPHWIKKNNSVAAKDCDNLLKPTLDAVQCSTWNPDEHNWHEHIFKVQSSREATTVYLFDLGEVIECFL